MDRVQSDNTWQSDSTELEPWADRTPEADCHKRVKTFQMQFCDVLQFVGEVSDRFFLVFHVDS